MKELEVGMEKADLLTKAMAELLTASSVGQEAADDGSPLPSVRRTTMLRVLEAWRGRLGKDLTGDGLANRRWGNRMLPRRLGLWCWCWALWHWATWHTRWHRLPSSIMLVPVKGKVKRKGKH